MKKIISRIFCFFLGRHSLKYVNLNRIKLHNFYGVSVAGRMFVCEKCGKFIFFPRTTEDAK